MNDNTIRSLKASRALLMAGLSLVGYFAIFALSSCSTMAGVGHDIQHVGEEVEEAAHGH